MPKHQLQAQPWTWTGLVNTTPSGRTYLALLAGTAFVWLLCFVFMGCTMGEVRCAGNPDSVR
jgi:hypothetical protein